MTSVFIAFILSLLVTIGLIRLNRLYPQLISDNDLLGVQKFHKTPVPRIGGLAIYLAIMGACAFRAFFDQISGNTGLQLVICAAPVFFLGLMEDLTKQVKPLPRLVAAFLSGLLFVSWMDASIYQTGLSILDSQLQIPIVSLLFTCLVLAGLTNAYNIIDGFNGLTSMIAVITLSAIGYVGFRNQDIVISLLALISIAAIIGFFLLNYPRGTIFLGDGGAYFLGFWVGCLSILLSIRNPGVSPWFAALINIYPIFETLFSIWRKKIIKKKSPSVPDGVHLHMLIYGRISKYLYADSRKHFIQNSRTSPFLWILSSMATMPACIWWNNTVVLQISVFLFCITYYWLYRRIVQFKIQKLYIRKY
jgi:UDP-N-acetylmuramyl pentapeptide phosphotransferase/UDP-N-acetylglucosamine-1-phosphate transferase